MKKALFLAMVLLPALLATAAPFVEGSKLADTIRKDHPRLYINKDDIPAIREYVKKIPEQFAKLKADCDALTDEPKLEFLTDSFEITPENRIKYLKPGMVQGWMLVKTVGAFEAAKLATMYQITGDEAYAKKGIAYLKMALEHFKWCYDHRVMVDWHSERRICAITAWDWLYYAMDPAERNEMLAFILYNIRNLQLDKHPYQGFQRNCYSGKESGNYGLRNLCWFAGVAGINEGVDEENAKELLSRGWILNEETYKLRDQIAEDNGLLGCSTQTYSLGYYAYSSIHFLMTYRSATGIDITDQVTHLKYLPKWYDMMTIPRQPYALSFGLGDLAKYTNGMCLHMVWTYMPILCHLYPEMAPLAMDLMQKTPKDQRIWHSFYPFFPFLVTKYDPTVKPETKDINLAQYYKFYGMVIMRSGNTEDDVYALFRTGAKGSYHMHYDESHFTIYHRGFLALDSGSRTDHAPQHHYYYAPQSVAHNTILIHQAQDDIPETPAPYWRNGTTVPETTPNGGQNSIGKAETLAYHHTGKITYAANDAHLNYLDTKCKEAVRQFVYLRPNIFVVFDRVESLKPDQQKEYLLHLQNEPEFIAEDTLRAVNGDGVIFQKTVLPAKAKLNPVGGPGKQFMAGGKNYPLKGGDEIFKEYPDNAFGAWRVETTDPTPAKRNYFLHVIEVGSKEKTAMCQVEPMGKYGVRIKADDGTVWEVSFQAEGDVVCKVRSIPADGSKEESHTFLQNL